MYTTTTWVPGDGPVRRRQDRCHRRGEDDWRWHRRTSCRPGYTACSCADATPTPDVRECTTTRDAVPLGRTTGCPPRPVAAPLRALATDPQVHQLISGPGAVALAAQCERERAGQPLDAVQPATPEGQLSPSTPDAAGPGILRGHRRHLENPHRPLPLPNLLTTVDTAGVRRTWSPTSLTLWPPTRLNRSPATSPTTVTFRLPQALSR